MWKFIKKGAIIMTTFIISIKNKLQKNSSNFSIFPSTDYSKHAPQSAKQLMHDNWQITGNSLDRAIKKVGSEIEKRKK